MYTVYFTHNSCKSKFEGFNLLDKLKDFMNSPHSEKAEAAEGCDKNLVKTCSFPEGVHNPFNHQNGHPCFMPSALSSLTHIQREGHFFVTG